MVASNSALENVFGTIGTVLWMVQLVPQIWKSFRTKNTDGLSEYLVLIWGISATFLATYNIVQNLNVPLILQPHVFMVLCLISWGQCLHYGRRYSKMRAFLMALGVFLVCGGLEIGMIFALRIPYRNGVEGARVGIRFVGILFSVLLATGLLPEYYEIWKRKEVVGISISFMIIDAMGGVFSDLSLVFARGDFNVIGAVGYSLVFVMDIAIVVAALILNPIARRKRLTEDSERCETRETVLTA